ncbi:MAG: ATP-binding protein [Thermoanaerobaculia bacterium]|nr:ATP-binding protein [Thermoanaerobaculia bacterium]
MGPLFWKFFAVFLLALVLAAVATGFVVWLHTPHRGAAVAGPAGLVEVAAQAIENEGLPGLHPLFQDNPDLPLTLLVIDDSGREVFGRPAPKEISRRFWPREVKAPSGERFTVLAVPKGERRGGHFRPRLWPPPVLTGMMGFLASLLVAWALARYIAQPIRSLRWAFEQVAAGRLDTRITPAMGKRRDEVADLGRGFDHMTGELERLVEGQRRLLHDVSHELRSPLARLQAAVGLGRQNPERATATYDRIEREVTRLDALVGELLTLSHLDAGSAADPVQKVDLEEFVAAIANDARFEAEAAGKRLEYRGMASEVFAAVHAEPLRRAFENVLRNAVKFTAPGTTVEADTAIDRGDFVLRVADRGPGIPEADLEAVFTPFFRGENGRVGEGTGLGLAIARRAMEVHGGSLRLTNREGGGLVAELRLPGRKGHQGQ